MTTDLGETAFPQTVQDVESVFLDDSVPNFRKALQETRHNEIITLTSILVPLFPYSFWAPIPAYGWYLWTTWTNIIYVAATFETRFIDWFRVFTSAIFTSIILAFILLWCQFASLPPVQWVYWWWSEKFNGNVGLINLLTPQLFKGLLPAQIAAADDGLSLLPEAIEPAGSTGPLIREFNLDIAKLLLQISAVVYERKSDAIYDSVDATAKVHGNKPKRTKFGANLPQFRQAIGSTFADINFVRDGSKLAKLGWNKHRWGTDIIEDFCKRTGLSYAPVSELNSSTSAFASFFWKGGGNWIVVAFKGTGPIDFPDYVTDLSSRLVHADEVLPTFSQLHKGFRDRIWPNRLVTDAEIRGRKQAWEQISRLLVILAKDLVKNQPAGDKINVWFTGHSLGCALSGLAYTRAINNFEEDFGDAPIVIRDAYVFGSPIVGNRPTSQRFNQVIKQQKEIKTLWRITNHDDLVATGGPQLGDNPNLELTSTNPGGLAHIGAEIRMLDYDKPSHFAGTLYDKDTIVRIDSKFTAEDLKEQRAQQLLQHPDWEKRVGWGNFVQQIPLLGRGFAHSAGLYWNQLAALAPINCVWVQGWDPVDPFDKLYTESISG
ncbi:Alpha/Beta hydrolase protein [Cantharellus anzutake]|uniref:Alpha/Beta hydrolase protein n=1 Tax=Cantharellus anzutake TaxID=1750568 RepID=UPI0019060F52|nr:Alpha/Beta hydrolase protein [Cantharellus anzutake]KAF8309376.1 Alpha/Beta hydrolase protein [Cantharellus anzutake]